MTATVEQVRTCGCGAPLRPASATGRCRTCTDQTLEQERLALIEDVEWLLATREHPDRIAARLGTNTRSLTRRLNRAGRNDLARHFKPTQPCTRCGGPCSKQATMCARCDRDDRHVRRPL